uniref:Cell wall protein-like n=1 Tax=Oryza sativa subsp. japonica TaxID=39947 RepID=Q6K5T1_ORYSJ|nr:cell wall protein-like [Oryza sativa Japonica Group]BAD25697.1 cell wall protein-like [Oryza sativa Japonica Group]
MAPPIARNGRAIPGRLPWLPAVFPVAVPPSPMPGSLSSPIKWNPLGTFSSFSPLPRSPVAAPPLSTVLLLSPTPPAASSHPYRLACAPSGRAVTSLGSATPSPSPASPSPLPKLAGTVSSSTSSGVATTPPPPAACATSQATASPEFRRNAVAHAGLSFLLVDVAFGSLFRRARASADVAISTSGIAAASGVFHAVLVSVQLPPAAHVASSPAPVVVVLPSFPVIVVFVPLSSRSRSSSSFRQVPQPRHCLRPRLRVAKRCAGCVSPSSKDRCRSRPLAFCLRHSRPSPPRPFVVVVPSPRRVVACSFACVLRVASVVLEVPEAWFAVVAEGSEGRSL